MRTIVAALLVISTSAGAAGPDGYLDGDYGDSGRSIIGYLESDTMQLRGIARGQNRTWEFGDDVNDRSRVYIARLLNNGQPDTTFGSNLDGRTRAFIPPALIAGTEAMSIAGAIVQSDGKPLVYGGLYPVNGETGAFPGVLCRFAVAGNFDGSFGSGGCTLLKTFLSATEICRVTDVAPSEDMFVAVGNCAAVDLVERPFLARVTSAGVVDVEFGGGFGLLTPAAPAGVTAQHYESVVVRADRRIAVLGEFQVSKNGVPNTELGVLQFDPGGTPDPEFAGDGSTLISFDQGGDNADHARDLALRPGGELVVLGQATGVNPARPLVLLAQLGNDGNTDNSFDGDGKRVESAAIGSNPNSVVRSLDLDPQGRAIVAGSSAIGQPAALPNTGSDFWIAVPWCVPPESDVRLFITSDTATSGLVSNSALAISIPFNVTPGLVTTLVVPPTVYLTGGGVNDLVENKGLHITAQNPVAVNVLAGRTFSLDGYTALPSEHLGLSYRVMAWGIGPGSGSTLAVAATQDNTTVTITPSITEAGHVAGVPYQVAMQQGQAYHLWTSGSPADLTGSTVVANKPIAVYGSHSCGNVPDASVNNCDTLYEQLLPLDTWGTNFITVPFAGRTAGDVVRVLANESGTKVVVNGVLSATLAAGEFYDSSRTTTTQIVSSRPVSVAQYAKGCKADSPIGPCYGDPFMLTLAPPSQWLQRYHAAVPVMSNGNYEHYFNIVAPASQIDKVLINGVALPTAAFTAVGSSGYFAASVATAAGSYVVEASLPISVSVYGFLIDGSESYGYPAAGAPLDDPQSPLSSQSSDDLILRFTAAGLADPQFGENGAVRLDHAAGYNTDLPSFDSGVRAFYDPAGIIVGSASRNTNADQSLFLSYRLVQDGIFRDDFEL